MRKQVKTLLGICGLSTIAVAGVLTITSCASTDPFEDYATGTAITIASQKDADYAKTDAAKHIYTFRSDFNWTSIDPLWHNASYLMMTGQFGGGVVDTATYASTQIYWEFVYYLAFNWKKNDKKSLSISGVTDTTKFVVADDENLNISLATGVTFSLNGSGTTDLTFSYIEPQTRQDHFQLIGTPVGVGANPYQFDSYGLFGILNNVI